MFLGKQRYLLGDYKPSQFKRPKRGDFMKCINAPTGEIAEWRQLCAGGWRDRGAKDEERGGGGMLIHIFHLTFWFLNWDLACDFFYLRMTQKVIKSARVHIQELGQLEKSQIMFQLHLINHAYLWLITCDYVILRKECSIMEKTRTSKSNRLMFKTVLYLI